MYAFALNQMVNTYMAAVTTALAIGQKCKYISMSTLPMYQETAQTEGCVSTRSKGRSTKMGSKKKHGAFKTMIGKLLPNTKTQKNATVVK